MPKLTFDRLQRRLKASARRVSRAGVVVASEENAWAVLREGGGERQRRDDSACQESQRAHVEVLSAGVKRTSRCVRLAARVHRARAQPPVFGGVSHLKRVNRRGLLNLSTVVACRDATIDATRLNVAAVSTRIVRYPESFSFSCRAWTVA